MRALRRAGFAAAAIWLVCALLAPAAEAQSCPAGYTPSGGVCVSESSGGGGSATVGNIVQKSTNYSVTCADFTAFSSFQATASIAFTLPTGCRTGWITVVPGAGSYAAAFNLSTNAVTANGQSSLNTLAGGGSGTGGYPGYVITPNPALGTDFVVRDSVAQNQTVTHVCGILIGADNGSALVDGDLGPQLAQCQAPADKATYTVLEIDVFADAGTPNVIVQRNHLGTATALLSGALATASAGAVACSNAAGTTGMDGSTSCTDTLENTTIAQGDTIGLTSGTAGGTAKRMSIQVFYQ